jgi:hypothetical protein
MFKAIICNFIRFVNGLLSVGIEKQISHASEVVVNTSIKLPKSHYYLYVFRYFMIIL